MNIFEGFTKQNSIKKLYDVSEFWWYELSFCHVDDRKVYNSVVNVNIKTKAGEIITCSGVGTNVILVNSIEDAVSNAVMSVAKGNYEVVHTISSNDLDEISDTKHIDKVPIEEETPLKEFRKAKINSDQIAYMKEFMATISNNEDTLNANIIEWASNNGILKNYGVNIVNKMSLVSAGEEALDMFINYIKNKKSIPFGTQDIDESNPL